MTANTCLDLRTDLKLTQQQLAERVGVSANTIARYERGELPVSASTRKLLEIIRAVHRAGPSPLRTKIMSILVDS